MYSLTEEEIDEIIEKKQEEIFDNYIELLQEYEYDYQTDKQLEIQDFFDELEQNWNL